MTITLREKEVPTDLPTARLYLNDIEDIVGSFAEALAKDDDDKSEIKYKFTVGERICDQIEDLPKITRHGTRNFSLQVSKGYKSISFQMDWSGSFWQTYSLSSEKKWSIYGKLEPIFKSRRLFSKIISRLVIFDFALGPYIITFILILAFIGLEKLLLQVFTRQIAVWVSLSSVAFLGAILARLVFTGGEVVFVNSADHAALREERAWKVIPNIVSGIIGLVVGILITYLKHKYWP